MEDSLIFSERPSRLDFETLQRLLVWASTQSVSDITLITGQPVKVKQHGRRVSVTSKPLTTPEINELVNSIYGNNGTARIAGGEDADCALLIKPSRDERYRYRFNATGILVDGNDGVSVTLRTIPHTPPAIKDMGVPRDLLESMCRAQGLCLITGETGSGKSTLQAAVLRYRVEDPEANLNVLTYESPIEFTYDAVSMPTSFVQQTEIPKKLPSFAAGLRNALRRDPDVIVVGESRDALTMSAAIEASKSGHLVYTTMHTNGVPATIRRAVGMFPPGEANGKAIDLVEVLNCIVTQRLLRTVDGKRVPAREFLVIDEQIRNQLLASPLDSIPAKARELTKKHGQTLFDDAHRLFQEGIIDEREYKLVAAGGKMQERDDAIKIEGVSSLPASMPDLDAEQ